MKYHNLLLAAGAAMVLGTAGAQAQTVVKGDPAPPQPVKALALMAAMAPVADPDRAIAFYTKGLGMNVGQTVDGAAVTEYFLTFPGGGPDLILLKPKAGDPPPRTTLTRVILAVPDLKALEARMIAAGYSLSQPIRVLPHYGVAVAHADDPEGNHIELIQRIP